MKGVAYSRQVAVNLSNSGIYSKYYGLSWNQGRRTKAPTALLHGWGAEENGRGLLLTNELEVGH
jgi:hypothetical protein